MRTGGRWGSQWALVVFIESIVHARLWSHVDLDFQLLTEDSRISEQLSKILEQSSEHSWFSIKHFTAAAGRQSWWWDAGRQGSRDVVEKVMQDDGNAEMWWLNAGMMWESHDELVERLNISPQLSVTRTSVASQFFAVISWQVRRLLISQRTVHTAKARLSHYRTHNAGKWLILSPWISPSILRKHEVARC